MTHVRKRYLPPTTDADEVETLSLLAASFSEDVYDEYLIEEPGDILGRGFPNYSDLW